MSVTVKVTDDQSGEEETAKVGDHDYFLLVTGDCHVDGIQTYPTKGTHVITIKGRKD